MRHVSMISSNPISNDSTSWETLLERMAQKLLFLQERLRLLTQEGARPGTVWSTYPEDEKEPFGPLVLILGNAVPGSDEWCALRVVQSPETAQEDRRYLEKEKSGLHFSCVVFLDQIFLLNKDRLMSCAGELGIEVYEGILSAIASPKPFGGIDSAWHRCTKNNDRTGSPGIRIDEGSEKHGQKWTGNLPL
jgi:hypothetical protein